MAEAIIAGSHYERDNTGGGQKILLNCYAEVNEQDPQRQNRLAETPGSLLIDDNTNLQTLVRGLFQADGFADGKLIIPDGTTVRTYAPNSGTWGSLTGSIGGSDRVQAAFGGVEAAFLAGGALYTSDGTSVTANASADADWTALLTDHSETRYTSIATLGQRLLATYGDRFAFSDSLDFDATTSLNYYTAESAPDGIVGGVVLGSYYFVFGTQTIEPWIQTGDTDNPFRVLVGQVIQRGCAARDSIVALDNTLFFIADDRTVRRLNGLNPINLNAKDPWVTRKLLEADMSSIVCSAIETEGHAFYVINGPDFCYVYDVATNSWHKRETYNETTWEWAYHIQVDGAYYAGSRLDEKLAKLSRDYTSDNQTTATGFVQNIVREFTAHLPVTMGRPEMGSIRVEGSKGNGVLSGQGSNPVITLYVSDDKGTTYEEIGAESLGAAGEYSAATTFYCAGRAKPEHTVLKFSKSDPVPFTPNRIAINEI